MLHSEFVLSEDDLSLDIRTIEENLSFCGFSKEQVEVLISSAEPALGNNAVTTAARAVFRGVFFGESITIRYPSAANPWPSFLKVADEKAAGALYTIIGAGFVPLVRKMHRRNHVPEQISRDTCSQVLSYNENHLRGRNRFGIYPNQFFWLRNYIIEDLLYLRLGRFEYMTEKYGHGGVVCRNKASGEILAFAMPDLNFDSSGFALDGSAPESEVAFKSVFIKNDDSLTGNRIRNDGSAENTLTTLSLDKWDIILQEGTPVLGMHIPAGGSMSPEKARESLFMAKKFYSALPDTSRRPVAVKCISWIFNPNLPEILPPDSNLVSLLKMVHLYPVHSGREDGLWFVFLHESKFDPKTASRASSLQRAILDYIEKGGRWRSGGMFIMMDEIQQGFLN